MADPLQIAVILSAVFTFITHCIAAFGNGWVIVTRGSLIVFVGIIYRCIGSDCSVPDGQPSSSGRAVAVLTIMPTIWSLIAIVLISVGVKKTKRKLLIAATGIETIAGILSLAGVSLFTSVEGDFVRTLIASGTGSYNYGYVFAWIATFSGFATAVLAYINSRKL